MFTSNDAYMFTANDRQQQGLASSKWLVSPSRWKSDVHVDGQMTVK